MRFTSRAKDKDGDKDGEHQHGKHDEK